MFHEIEKINRRPDPFQFYTADELWTNTHTSKAMLDYHLNEAIDVSSRNMAFIERSFQWIASQFKFGPDTAISDFGCGPGLYTTRFARKGAVVTGIDFSKNSLDYARHTAKQEGLKVNYVNTNYLEFQTNDRFALITMIMCDFCALSPSQRSEMLKKFHLLLKPGGSVLLDVYSMAAFDQKQESAEYEHNHLKEFWSPETYYCFINTFKYQNEKVSLDKYTIIEQSRTRQVYNWLQYFSRQSLKREFQNAGFIIDHYYANVAGDLFDSGLLEFAVVAKKCN